MERIEERMEAKQGQDELLDHRKHYLYPGWEEKSLESSEQRTDRI